MDPERTGVRWRQIKAPLDVAGENANTPPPLRKVFYCPTHLRAWLTQAHRVLETKVILAHISTNAKPVFGLGQSQNNDDPNDNTSGDAEASSSEQDKGVGKGKKRSKSAVATQREKRLKHVQNGSCA